MKDMTRNAYNALGKEYYKSRKEKSDISYFYNELLEMPMMIKMLGDLSGKKVLDLGCGPGFHIGKLKRKCREIRGIDLSSEEIALAKKDHPAIDLRVGDAEKLPYKKGEFDIVFSSLMMGHFEDWAPVLQEVSRVLKKKGEFTFSIHNPVTEDLAKKTWFFKKFRVIEHYFEEKWRIKTWGERNAVSAEVGHHHKTYGTIIHLLTENGFEIISYEDCYPLAEGKDLFPDHYEKATQIPYFCVWKVRKR